MTKEERFWNKVIKREDNECWGWTGCVHHSGYGKIWFNNKVDMAHRVSWIIHFGPIPEGLNVCHTCDNRICPNPYHLFLGTDQDNIDDKCDKGRQAKGSKSGHNKINEEDATVIRYLVEEEGFKHKEVAEMYGVCRSNITLLINRKNWKHI